MDAVRARVLLAGGCPRWRVHELCHGSHFGPTDASPPWALRTAEPQSASVARARSKTRGCGSPARPAPRATSSSTSAASSRVRGAPSAFRHHQPCITVKDASCVDDVCPVDCIDTKITLAAVLHQSGPVHRLRRVRNGLPVQAIFHEGRGAGRMEELIHATPTSSRKPRPAFGCSAGGKRHSGTHTARGVPASRPPSFVQPGGGGAVPDAAPMP